MERNFYEQLDAKIENNKKTIHFWMVKSTSQFSKRCLNWNEESVRMN